MEDSLYLQSRYGLIIKYVKRNEPYDMNSIHFHNSFELYYLIKGERIYYINNERYKVNAGNLVIINSNQIHQTCVSNSEDYYHERILLQFNKETLETIFPNQELNIISIMEKHYGTLSLASHEQKYIEQLLFDMLKESKQKSTAYQIIIQMRLKELLIFLYRKLNHFNVPLHLISSTNPTTKNIVTIAEYISNNYKNITCLDDITSQFFMDKSYLCRKFKEITGYTINDYINIKRIQQSQILLKNKSLKINEIALMVGFNSSSTYIKTYNKYMRVSPLKYRKTLLEYHPL